MIKAIIFDVGGVLVRTNEPHHRRDLETELGLSPGEAEYLVFNSEMGLKAQRGEITTEALWAWLQGYFRFDGPQVERFRQRFFAGDQLDTQMVDLIRQLHGPYQTAIISNASDNLMDNLTRVYPMADAFDLIVGSAYEGIMKPDAAIFLSTLERLGREPQECVFVDDFMHNIDGAKAVGLHGIHFQPGTDLGQALGHLGIYP